MTAKRVVHGDDLLYRFFQDALSEHDELFAQVPQLLISATAVWWPLEVYYEWPILLPWVVRDPSCRGNRRTGAPDEWSSPNPAGYLRDDNSLVKSLPRSLTIRAQERSTLNGARLGSEFVAAHAWRVVHHDDLASRIPLLNSFVPNLVWLPSQVAKLTDREDSVVQRTLQAMAIEIYREAPVRPSLRDVVAEAWSLLPEATAAIEPIRFETLNKFEATESFFRTRKARLGSVVGALNQLERGESIPNRVVTRRYAEGLPSVSGSARARLSDHLQRFAM